MFAVLAAHFRTALGLGRDNKRRVRGGLWEQPRQEQLEHFNELLFVIDRGGARLALGSGLLLRAVREVEHGAVALGGAGQFPVCAVAVRALSVSP